VFWKSSVPAGQEYVLLATTNDFSYLTADLDPTKTYFFYVRANSGIYFFNSNVVELFVSCGQGVVLSVDPPGPPGAQIPPVNVYAAVELSEGSGTYYMYMQSLEEGPFSDLGEFGSGYALRHMCVSPNEDVYVAQEVGFLPGDIWIRQGGIGSFVRLNQTSRRWYGMAAAPNGDIYSSVYSGDIYKRAGGVGDFVAQGAGNDARFDMTAGANGAIYYCVNGGGIYVKEPGESSWVSTGAPNAIWRALGGSSNGDVYAGAVGGGSANLWIRYGGQGSFIDTGMGSLSAAAMTCTRKGNVYLGGRGTTTEVYVRYLGVGSFIVIPDPNRSYYGLGARVF